MSLFYRTSGSLATLSFIGSLIVILTYLMMPDLRKHPTNMVFYLSLCDCLLSLKFMVTAVLPYSDTLELHTSTCYVQAGWAQFFGIGSIAWNGMISLNLIINLQKQGFAKTSSLGKYYHMFVWLLAIGTTGAMYGDLQRIGPSGDGTCWVTKSNLLFFIPLIIFFALSLTSLVLSFVRTKHVSGLSDASRRGVVFRMVTYTGVFLLCWSGPLIHRMYTWATNEKEEDTSDAGYLMLWDACGICLQGFANAMVWLTNPSFFVPFKRRFIDKYFSCLIPTREQSPLLHTLQDTLQDSKQDINRIDTVLRRNIITCILLGLRSSLKEQVQTEVTHRSYAEFKVYDYTKLSAEQDFEKSLGYDFVDYAPHIFASMRTQAGISPQDYMASMHPAAFLGKLNDQLQKFSEGRSNSFFIFSPDRKFILKTLTEDEAKLLLSILPNLYQYFLANNCTLLPRFYGCHGVRVPHGDIVTVVIMGNVFSSLASIHEQYDLKGSWVNRYSGLDKLEPGSKNRAGMDLDLKRKLKLPTQRKQQFLNQISKDALFLCSLNIMDFSLLLGFHFLDTPSSYTPKTKIEMQDIAQIPGTPTSTELPDNLQVHTSSSGTEVYFTGIIDILQLYNTQKKAERFFKVYILGKDKFGLSSMQPEAYARRFIQGMNKIVE